MSRDRAQHRGIGRWLAAALLAVALPAAAADLPSGRPAQGRAWTDLYAEAYGWRRVTGADLEPNLVPTLRVRALADLPVALDLHPYLFAQVTRDLASTSGPVPRVYADNRAMLGGGLLLRLWRGRVGLFAQAGPAFDLVAGRSSELDARGGAFAGLEQARCWPRPVDGAELRADPCLDAYSEAIWLRRFDDDVVGFARGRAGLTLAVTGPVAWGVLAQARAAADRNGDFYDNYADAGAGLRVRLLAPFRADLTATFDAGRFSGREAADPAPSRLGYAELRVLFATYLESRR